MALKTIATILTDMADNENLEITPALIRDAFESMKDVGGTMHATDVTQAVTAAWAAFTAYEASIDTRGLTEDLPNGTFTLSAGADGVYSVDATVSISFPGTGRIDMALTKNGGLTPFRAAVDILQADKLHQFTICGTGNLVAGDVIGLAIKGSASATGTVASAQFRAVRI